MFCRVLLLLLLSVLTLAGCQEDKSAMALKNLGGVVSREDDRTTVRYVHTKDTDTKLKRLNFQIAGTFIRISHIELNACDASDRSIEQLTRIKDLEVLHILQCPHLTNVSMKLLGQNLKLQELVILHTHADDHGFEDLAKLSQLRTLEISGIGDNTLNAISQLKNLERLSLVDSKINESGARSLGRMPNLRVLDFYRCEMRENIEQQVRHGLPQTRITIHRNSK